MSMSPRLLRPRNAFSPKSFAGLQLWLDASDQSTMTLNGSTVSAWKSKAGVISVTQSTASSQPTLVTNYYSGRSSLSFDGGDVMSSASAALAIAPCTSFIVCDEASAVNFAGLLVGYGAVANDYDSTGAFITTAHDGTGNAFVRRGSNTLAAAGTALVAETPSVVGTAMGKKVLAFVSDANTAYARSNGVAGVTDAAHTASGASTGAVIGGRYVSGSVSALYRFNGYISEVLHYSSTLSSSQITTVEKWLGARWGITLT